MKSFLCGFLALGAFTASAQTLKTGEYRLDGHPCFVTVAQKEDIIYVSTGGRRTPTHYCTQAGQSETYKLQEGSTDVYVGSDYLKAITSEAIVFAQTLELLNAGKGPLYIHRPGCGLNKIKKVNSGINKEVIDVMLGLESFNSCTSDELDTARSELEQVRSRQGRFWIDVTYLDNKAQVTEELDEKFESLR